MAVAEITMSTPEPSNLGVFYRPELDALRFFAFFAVFLFHLPRHTVDFYVAHQIPRMLAVTFNAISEAGCFGVDLFFVLSAYLITELLLREKASTGDLDVRSFYVRRILRIWPLYFFFLAMAMLPVFNPRGSYTWKHLAAFVLLSGNWGIILWGWPLKSAVLPMWSLSIEEQFYLLWPPLVRKLSRSAVANAAVVILALATAARVLLVRLHAGNEAAWCNTPGRLDPVALGILLAVVLRGRVPRLTLMIRMWLLAVAIVVTCWVAVTWDLNHAVRLEWLPTLAGYPIVALCCCVVVIATLGITDRVPSILLYLGKISFGLYVFHTLSDNVTDMIVTTNNAWLRLVLRVPISLGLTIALSALSYRYLEAPFLRLKKRFTKVESRAV